METDARVAISGLFETAREYDYRLTVAVHPSLFDRVFEWLNGRPKGYYLYLRRPVIERLSGVTYLEFPRYQRILGETSDFVIFDSTSYFEANAFAAAADTISGGGAFVILLGRSKPYCESLGRGRFSGRLLSLFMDRAAANGLFLNLFPTGWVATLPANSGRRRQLSGLFMSEDQKMCYDEILGWHHSGVERVLFITSRRGRGKSAVVGMSLAELVDAESEIHITSSLSENLATLLRHLSLGLSHRGYKLSEDVWNRKVQIGGCELFVGPPERARPNGLLVIDEASSLPVSVLLELVRTAPRTIITTTTYGYEGSGRSFEVRLVQHLRRLGLRELKLFSPVRFSDGDPLEKSLSDTFGFEPMARSYPASGEVRAEWMDSVGLNGRDYDFVKKAYGILTEAHYRNEPSDLLRMLEDDRSFTAVASVGSEPCAVASLVEDGPLTPAQVASVLRGASHPGNLISERLLARTFDRRIADHKGIRVSRIAVIPHLQRKGYGRMLLNYVEGHAAEYDWLGAAFSADTNVLSFWLNAGYKFVHLSWNREPYAFNPSIVCIKPLSDRAMQFVEDNMALFRAGVFLHALRRKTLPPKAYALVIKSLSAPVPIQESERRKLEGFAEWNLPFELIVPELAKNLYSLAALMGTQDLENIVKALCNLPFSQDMLRKGLRRILSGNVAADER